MSKLFENKELLDSDMGAALQHLNNEIEEKMGESPKNTGFNDEIFEKSLLKVEDIFGLDFHQTYTIGKNSNYPTSWSTWRSIAGGRYRPYFERFKENVTMKRSNLKEMIREILKEVTQKDLKSTMPGVRSWNIKKVPNQPAQQTPNFSLMTLDNLKALKDKAGRTLTYLKKNKPEEYSQYGPLVWKEWQKYDFEIKRRLKQINQKIREGDGTGYSHNVSFGDYEKERDPLNDPELNGKLNESYRFHEFKWMATMDGFNMPVDVYYGKILLGVIQSRPDGYVILSVIGPDRSYNVTQEKENEFKTKNDAAKPLHLLWKTLRTKKV